MSNHLSIASEGLAPTVFSHKIFAKLGFGYSVEVIITPAPTVSSGGGRYIYDNTVHYDITFIIRWDSRVITKSYRNILFDTVARIYVKFKELRISTYMISSRIISSLFTTKLNSINTTPIDISVNEKPTDISVKRILK
jgi:hypothetical protein